MISLRSLKLLREIVILEVCLSKWLNLGNKKVHKFKVSPQKMKVKIKLKNKKIKMNKKKQ